MESRRTTRRLGVCFSSDANCAACVVLRARGSTVRRRSLRAGRITAENNRRPPSTNLRLRSSSAFCDRFEGRALRRRTNARTTGRWSAHKSQWFAAQSERNTGDEHKRHESMVARRFIRTTVTTHRHDRDSIQPHTLLTIERLLSDISWTRRSIARTSLRMLNTSVVWQEWGQTHVMPERLPVMAFVM